MEFSSDYPDCEKDIALDDPVNAEKNMNEDKKPENEHLDFQNDDEQKTKDLKQTQFSKLSNKNNKPAFDSRIFEKRSDINQYLKDLTRILNGYGFSQFGKRSHSNINHEDLKLLNGFGFSKFGKRSTSNLKEQDLKHLQGFGFSKFGKRSNTNLDDDDLKHLKGFGFSKFGKRTLSNIDKEDLKHLKGFGFSKFGKRTTTNINNEKLKLTKETLFQKLSKNKKQTKTKKEQGKVFEILKKSEEKVNPKDLKHLQGFGFSKFGKREQMLRMQMKKEDLKYLRGAIQIK